MVCALLLAAVVVVRIMDANGTLDALIVSHAVAPSRTAATSTPTMPTATETRPDLTRTSTAAPTASKTPEPTATQTFTPTATPNADGQEAVVIGYSVQDRPIEVYRFGSGPVHRLIYAGIHGGYEYNTVDLAYQLIDYLRLNLELIPEDITLFIVPVLNVDGFVNGRGQYNGRANARGVDLNRNWDLNWVADWDKSGCWNYVPIHGGTAPFSEPETLALSQFMVEEQIEAVISYHSAALGIFHGGQPDPHPPSVSLAEAVAAVSPYSYPGLSYGCSATGMSAHWATAQDIAAVDIELTNHSDTDFEINLRILNAFLTWKR